MKKWIIIVFLWYIKMSGTTYYQRKEDLILKRVKEFYKNNKKY